MPTTAEQEIYSRLTSAPTFHPANAVLFQRDWTLEPGDVVTVNSGDDSYSVPIYALKLNWMGSDQSTSANADRIKASIESTGNEKREPLPELRRKEYQTARSSYGYYRAQQQEIDEHYRHLTETTDRGMAEAFGIIGVKLGPDGMPMKDANGNYIWDDSGTGGEIWGHLNHDAWSTQIMHHIKDENGNILSLGEVYTDAYGNVLINAINGEGSGELKINADRIAIQSTSGSGITFDNQGNISINAGEVVTRINNQSENIIDINADRILIGSNRTLNSILGINSEGGYAYFTGQVGFFNSSQSAASLVTINNGKVNAPTLQVANEGSLIFGALGNNSITLTHQILGSMVRSFSVSGNVLTLTPFVGEAVNFSKATTLTGAWSSGVYTVTASPQGNTESTQIYLGATGNGSSNFSVNTYHDSIAAANIAISDYIYLTEEVAAKTVSAHWHNAQGTVYGVISTQATYNAGQNDVDIVKGTWGNGSTDGTRKIDFTKSAGTQRTQSVVLSLASVQMVSTDPNQWTVTAYDGNANTGASIIVDATSRYNAGWGEARRSVGNFPESTPQTLTGSITFKKPSATVDGTADEYPYTLDVDNSYVYLKYGINPVARISNPAFANGKSAHTATSAGTVTLTSSDTGSSVSNTTVTYSNGDTTASVPITIDASAVYGQGKTDHTATSISNISITAAEASGDVSDITKTVTVTYSNGDTASVTLTIDATAVYNAGYAAGQAASGTFDISKLSVNIGSDSDEWAQSPTKAIGSVSGKIGVRYDGVNYGSLRTFSIIAPSVDSGVINSDKTRVLLHYQNINSGIATQTINV